MKAVNIIWETDGEGIELPTEMEIPSVVRVGSVADYLSDETGCFVKSYNVEL